MSWIYDAYLGAGQTHHLSLVQRILDFGQLGDPKYKPKAWSETRLACG